MSQTKTFPARLGAALLAAALSGCGGGGGSDGAAPPPPPPPPPPPAVQPGQVSVASPYSAACGIEEGTVYINAEVEPFLAVNPVNPLNLIAVYQQDRWSNGAARGNLTAVSADGGANWAHRAVPFSVCAGGPFLRATDPWVTFGPSGIAYQMALGTTGGTFSATGSNAMLASRSTDGGLTWSTPVALIQDTAPFFNDKNAMTADPTDARYVYASWDRLRQGGGGPAYFARSVDSGLTWEAARAIFDPGTSAQTIGGLVVVAPNGILHYFFTHIVEGANSTTSATIAVMRSTDKGATWSAPSTVAALLARGASDPETGTRIRDGSILAQAAAGPNGSLHVVWQDARFSGGVRDGIAYTSSADGGLTWRAPVQVNADASVVAFTPQVHVRADGTLGITYFDLRSNTADPAVLGTDYWLVRSTDGVAWSEARVAAPFNLNTAPNAGGYFLGDYMGLQSVGTTFLALYVRTTGQLDNRTDVFLTRMGAAPGVAAEERDPKRALALEARREMFSARRAVPAPMTRAFQEAVSANIARARATRRSRPGD